MSTGTYQAHRKNKREWILEIAEELFINNGIEQITIGDIANKSRMTRATIYKYFANKEEMAGEILKTITKGWVERNEREVWSFQGTGRELVERFMTSHFNYLLNNAREARFMAEFNYLYSKKMSIEDAMKLFSGTLEGERQRLQACIRQGQTDGSLRKDIGPELLLASILNFNSGMMTRLGEFGDKVEGEYGLNVQSIFRQICRLFLDGIQAHPPRTRGGGPSGKPQSLGRKG